MLQQQPKIYLDFNSKAPVHSYVKQALFDYLSSDENRELANPSSIHEAGRSARSLDRSARDSVIGSLHLDLKQFSLNWTSSGTEANQWVIRTALVHLLKKKENPIWAVATDVHDSVRSMIPFWEEQGGKVTLIPVDSHGVCDFSSIDSADFISVLWVNNETGVIQSLKPFAHLQNEKPLLHIDAAQSWGKLCPQTEEHLKVFDYITLSGHKRGAPTGIGAVVRKSPLSPWILGHQEGDLRGGTENLLGIVGMKAASEIQFDSTHVEEFRNQLQFQILSLDPRIEVFGKESSRVGHTLFFGCEVWADHAVPYLDLHGFEVSSGSACSSGSVDASPVLLSMGKSPLMARSGIRISLPSDPNDCIFQESEVWVPRFIEAIKGLLGNRVS
ncbi:MAG: hypothetical protein CL678_05430 [Bdellovibrionaceae bacterium]|nr:hypothetical protein [Pseudobdellovibrionaceae bacterium]|tara:strand:- start:1663 stop:2820 length:1158 start_codon:yes stop_codon:yes gene_type:complete